MKNINLVILALLIGVIFTDLVACKKSKDSDVADGECKGVTNTTCPEDLNEIYTEEHTHEDRHGNTITSTYKQCCTPDSDNEQQEKSKAVGCQISDCLDSSTEVDSLCTKGVNKRWVDGKQLDYEAVTYDTCQKDKNTLGSEALCCPQNSQEGMLTSLLGAEKHQFPHFATVRIKEIGSGTGICSGTIYNERYIITASHCMLSDGEIKPKEGSIVELDVQIANKDNPLTYKVEELIPHNESTKWQKDSDSSPIRNDIGLVKLAEDIKFGPNVKALPIAAKGFDPFMYGEEAILVGIGNTDTLHRANMLQRANVLLRSDKRNIEGHGPWHKYTMEQADAVLFVGGIQDDKVSPRSAPGDSGGPAICRDEDGNAVLCGLDSNGPDLENCEKNLDAKHCYPIAFMEVQHYHDWIVSIAGDQKNAQVLKEPLYGAPVPDGKYEHQVHIVTKMQSCGGTLIEKDLVLTAAHCVADDDGNALGDISVITGVRNVTSSGKKYNVAGVQVLDGFKKGKNSQKRKRIAKLNTLPTPKDPYYMNDLALVKLTEKVNIETQQLVKIGKAIKSASDDVTWNTEVSLPLNSTKSGGGVLQQRQFKLLNNDVCQKRMDRASYAKYDIKVDDNIMCGEEKYNGGAQCDRELGGGLMCQGDNGGDEVLCGVQVFRFCQLALPSAFLDISLYTDWIEAAKAKF